MQPLELRVCVRVCVCERGHGDVQYQHALWLGEEGGELQARGSREGLSDQPVAYVSTTQLHSNDPTEKNNIIIIIIINNMKHAEETSKLSFSYLF